MTKYMADEPLFGEKLEKPAPLYQLPISGDWVTLADVKGIRILQGNNQHLPTVVVEGVNMHHSIYCRSLEEACTIRDKIAADRKALTGST